MILDIIVILIFLISTLRGKVRGFGDSALRLVSLVASIALGTMLTEPVGNFIKLTPIDDLIQDKLIDVMQGEKFNILDFIPDVIGDTLKQLGIGSIEIDVRHFTNTAVLVLSFLMIILAVSIVTVVLRKKLKKARKDKTVIGTVDSSVGFLFGMIKGAILVFLFLAFMFPLAGIFMPENLQAINENLNNSFIAGPLYDINPLILFIRTLSL